MRQFFVIFVLLGFLMTSFSDCVVIAIFLLNRDRIARDLCEQHMQPGNTCRGCCQLQKALNKATTKQPLPTKTKEHNVLPFLTAQQGAHPGRCADWTMFIIAACAPLRDPATRDIDHPPNRFSA